MIRRILVAVLAVTVIAIVALWFARRSIADNAIAGELAKRGVTARYKVAEIGFGWQRLENLVIGDPSRPDLTADWAEVRLEAGWNGVRATELRAGGVRLRGRLADGKVSWGAIDKLLPKAGGGPFRLPALDVTLDDARLALATPWGAIGAKLDGRGNLRDGFTGKLAAIAPQLASGRCRVTRATAYVDVRVRDAAPAVIGPVRAAGADCGGVRLGASSLAIDAVLGQALDTWRGKAALDLGALATADAAAGRVTGQIAFSGDSRATRGTMALSSPAVRASGFAAAGVSLDAAFDTRDQGGAGGGTLRIARASTNALAGVLGPLAEGARGTPLAPLAAQLAGALGRAAQGAAVEAQLTARRAGADVTLSRLQVRTVSGALLTVSGGSGIRFANDALQADSRLELRGGGFPAVAGDFRRAASGETTGTLRVAPYAAGDARLVLTPVRFLARPNGYRRLTTIAALDGPIEGGRVRGLTAPVVVARLPRGDLVANPGCTPVAFAVLTLQRLTLQPTRLEACPESGALVRVANGRATGALAVASPAVRGRIGATPLTLAARRARFDLATRRFALDALAARLGSVDRLSRIDIARFAGSAGPGGLNGRFDGLAGQIGKVPLLIDGGEGIWRFARGVLDVTGAARVSDDNAAPRFNPLAAETIALRLADSRIVATGLLRAPQSGVQVARVDLSHDLGASTGRATLTVDDLRFDSQLQPEALTELTLGVIANVRGAVRGRGDIAWDASGVTSTGRFATDGLGFAAAFGPVDGAKGEVVFTDLLGLVTAPGQVATIGSINPGIPIVNGQLRYRLAADRQIVVEGGEWRFAGGALRIEPTVLDMREAAARRLVVTIDGLDAAKFIQSLDFDNIAATGLFDGRIPLVFDAQGGRIEGGSLVARPGGGTLAYVGEVSNADMNIYAKLAFDALKSLRYNNLKIDLNGPLDGEMVSTLDFRGVNQNPLTPQRNFLLRQVQRLPFRFNVVVRGPFRELVGNASIFREPIKALRRALPPPPPIQPGESGKR